MKKLKIYLDTSVINFLFVDDAPDYRKATEEFFRIHIKQYEVYVSDIYFLEINKTPDIALRNLLLLETKKYDLIHLKQPYETAVDKLAHTYIKSGIIPKNKIEDAMHIGISTVYEMDVLLSWNFKHLANISKQIKINAINEQEGYLKKLNLLTPLGVGYDEK